MDKKPPKCFLDAFLRLRPGAFASNVDLLLKLARMSARAGHRQLVLPSDAVQGGDCGSLAAHPAFVKACAKAEARFLDGLAKIKNLPKIVWVDGKRTPDDYVDDFSCSIVETLITEAGSDPRFPFGGRPEEVFPRQVCGLARRLGGLAFTAWTVFFAGLWLLLLHAPLGIVPTLPRGAPEWGGVLFLALLPTSVSFFGWNEAQKTVPLAHLSFLEYFTPFVAAVCAVAFRHDVITAWQWIGIAVVIASAALQKRSE